jgi:hypothetical protein
MASLALQFFWAMLQTPWCWSSGFAHDQARLDTQSFSRGMWIALEVLERVEEDLRQTE